MNRSQFVSLVLLLLVVGWTVDHLQLSSMNSKLRGQVIEALKERDYERKARQSTDQLASSLESELRQAKRALREAERQQP